MFGAIEVQNSSSAVFDGEEAVERSKVQRRNRKEVERRDDIAGGYSETSAIVSPCRRHIDA